MDDKFLNKDWEVANADFLADCWLNADKWQSLFTLCEGVWE